MGVGTAMKPFTVMEYCGWRLEFVQTRVSVVVTATRPGWRNLSIQALDYDRARDRRVDMIGRTGDSWRMPQELPY